MNYMFYDLETGGLTPNRNPIIELGFIILDEKLKELERGECLVQNYGILDPAALKVSGIKEDDLAERGIPKEALYNKLKETFAKYKGKVALVGHNIISFDNRFLTKLFEDFNDDLTKHVSNAALDTLLLSRLVNQTIPSHSLKSLCAHYGIPMTTHHRAIADVETTIKLFKALLSPAPSKQAMPTVRIQI